MPVSDSLLKRALMDQETGLGNSLLLRMEVEQAIDKAKRYGFPISLVTVRCEGGEVGTLSELGRLLGSVVRRSDCLARIADREFRLLLTHEDAQQSPRVIERLRRICEDMGQADVSAEPVRCSVVIESQVETRDFGRLLDGL